MFSAPKRLAALEREIADLKNALRLEKRASLTINGNVHIGTVYLGPDGLHHTPFEGKGEIVSSAPIEVSAPFHGGLDGTLSAGVELGQLPEKTDENTNR